MTALTTPVLPSMRVLSARERYARRKARTLGTRVERVNLKLVLRSANGICGLCQQPFAADFSDVDFDHIVPLSKGGSHVQSNLHATHVACNRSKKAG